MRYFISLVSTLFVASMSYSQDRMTMKESQSQAEAAIAIAKAKRATPLGKAATGTISYEDAVRESVKLRRPLVLFVGVEAKDSKVLTEKHFIPVRVNSYEGDKEKDPKAKRILVMSPGATTKERDTLFLRKSLPGDTDTDTIVEAAEQAKTATDGIAVEVSPQTEEDDVNPDFFIGFNNAPPSCANGNCPQMRAMPSTMSYNAPRTYYVVPVPVAPIPLAKTCPCTDPDCTCQVTSPSTAIQSGAMSYSFATGDDGAVAMGKGPIRSFFAKIFQRASSRRQARMAVRGW